MAIQSGDQWLWTYRPQYSAAALVRGASTGARSRWVAIQRPRGTPIPMFPLDAFSTRLPRAASAATCTWTAIRYRWWWNGDPHPRGVGAAAIRRSSPGGETRRGFRAGVQRVCSPAKGPRRRRISQRVPKEKVVISRAGRRRPSTRPSYTASITMCLKVQPHTVIFRMRSLHQPIGLAAAGQGGWLREGGHRGGGGDEHDSLLHQPIRY